MKKVNKKDRNVLLIVVIAFVLVILFGILLFVRMKKYNMAKQDAILIGNLALNKYLSEEEHLKNIDNMLVGYNLESFGLPYSVMECPINNKTYDKETNSDGFSVSHATINIYEDLLDISVQLKCGKHYIKYSFSSDYSNSFSPDVDNFNIEVY